MLDPRQEELYRAWCREAAAHGDVPPRSAFDPVDFPHILSTLAIYELLPSGAIRLRLIGTDIVRAWGLDNTGRYLHEIMEGDYYDFIRGHIEQCSSQRKPIYSHSCFRWDRGRSLDTRRLLLPYRRNDTSDAVGFVLLSQVFDHGKIGPSIPLVGMDSGFEFFELDRQVLRTSPAEHR